MVEMRLCHSEVTYGDLWLVKWKDVGGKRDNDFVMVLPQRLSGGSEKNCCNFRKDSHLPDLLSCSAIPD